MRDSKVVFSGESNSVNLAFENMEHLTVAELVDVFDPSTSSMRNIEPPAKSKMAARGPQNGPRGLERGPIPGYWAL